MKERLASPLFLVSAASVALTMSYALTAGQDINWDLRNYHFWTVHAMLQGRTFFDLAPAQIQSWTNPIVYLPAYGIVKYVPPILGAILLGAWAGVNGILLYQLSVRLIALPASPRSAWIALLITACGLTGPIFLSQVGTTFSDVVCSILVLAGLLSLYAGGARGLFLCGVLLGAAVGLKLTNAAFALAMAITLLVGWRALNLSLVRYAAFAVGGCMGALLTGGYWCIYLYLETGNPLFPYYNALFLSPLYDAVNFHDGRFLPASFLDGLSYPFQWLVGMHPSAERPFRDARFALLTLIVPAASAAASFRSGTAGEDSYLTRRDSWPILVFVVSSYLVWILMWGIHRYITALELIAGLALFIGLDRLPLPQRSKLPAFTGLVLFCVLWTQPAVWGRYDRFGESYFAITDAPPELSRHGSLFVMVGGGQPIAYLIPYLPEDARFVRLTGNFGSLTLDRPLGVRAQDILQAHSGPIRSLSVEQLRDDDRALLRHFGLEAGRAGTCKEFRSRLESFVTCPLQRSPDPPEPVPSQTP